MNSSEHNIGGINTMKLARVIQIAVGTVLMLSFIACGGGGSTFIDLNPSQDFQATQPEQAIPNPVPDGSKGEIPQGEFPSFPIPSTGKYTARADFPILFNGNDQYEAAAMRGWTRKCAEAAPDGNALRITPTADSYIGWVEYRIGDADGEQLNYLNLTGGADTDTNPYYILVANWTKSQWDMFGPITSNDHSLTPTDFEDVSGNADYSNDYVSSGGDFYWCFVVFSGVQGVIEQWELEGETDDLLPPTSVAATDGDHPNFIRVSWVPTITLTTPERYQVYRSDSADYNDYQTVGTPVQHGGTGVHTFDDDTIDNGDTYRYKVQALKDGHPDSTLSSFDEGYLTQLQPPTAVSATDGTEVGQITISWDAPEGDPAPVTYEVFRAAAQGGAYTESVGETADASTSLIYDFDSDVEYWFKVRSKKPGYDDSPIDGQTADQGQSMPLQAPEGLLAGDGTSDAHIEITWNPPGSGPEAEQYKVYRNTSETGTYTLKHTTTETETSWNDTTTDPGTHYWYKATAIRDGGSEGYQDGPDSNSNEGYRGADLLPPQNPAATNGDHVDKIIISWEHPGSGEQPDGYKIWRADSQGGDYGADPIYESGYVTSYDDPIGDLPDPVGATYWYKVQSYRSGFDDSGFTSEFSGYVTQLQQPQNIQATDETEVDEIIVSWDAHSSGPAPENYKVWRAGTEDGTYEYQGETGDTSRTFTDSVTTGVVLWYKVTSLRAGYDETPLDGQQANAGRVMQPQPPTAITASDGTEVEQVAVSWTPPGDGPAPGYFEIWTAASESGTYTYLDETADDTPNYTHDVSTGATVWYKVKSAIDATYDTSDIDAQSADSGYPMQLQEPTAIVASDATAPDEIEVTWGGPADGPDPDGYKIWRCLTENGTYDDLGADPDGVSPYVDNSSDAQTGATYWYKAESTLIDYDPSGTDTQQANDGWVGLSPPSSVTASQGDYSGHILIEWELPEMGLEPDSYDLYRYSEAEPTPTKINQTPIEALEYTDSDVSDGNSRFYKLKSVLAGYSDSDYSEVAEGWLTGPEPPTGINATDGTIAYQTSVSFIPPTGGPTPNNYQLLRCLTVDGTYVPVGSPNDSSPVVDDDETLGETVYYYKVKSQLTNYNDSEPSTDSDAGNKMPLQEPATLIASDDVAAHIEIDWDVAGSGPDADDFDVYMSTTSGPLGDPIHTTADGSTTYYEYDPGDYETYYFTVKATRQDYEDSPPTNQDSGRRLTIPDPPSTVSASDGSYTGYIRVTCATSTDATMYQFWRADTENGTYVQKSGNEGTNVWNDTTVTPGQTYWYKAKAGNAAGWSNLSTAKNDGWRKLSPPQNVTATLGTSSPGCDVDWSNVSGSNGYIVYRSGTEGDRGSEIGTPSISEYNDYPPNTGTNYWYTIVATCSTSGRDSGDSTQVRGWASRPKKPTSVWVEDLGEHWRIHWTRPNPRDGCKFWLYYHEGTSEPTDWEEGDWNYTGGNNTSNSMTVPKDGYSGDFWFGVMTRRLDYLPEWNTYFDSYIGIASEYVSN